MANGEVRASAGVSRVEAAGPGSCRLDHSCHLMALDAAMASMFGLIGPTPIGRPLWDLLPALRGTDLRSCCLALLSGAGPQQSLFHYEPLDRWYVFSATPVGDAGAPWAVDLRFVDVTDAAGGPAARIRAERLDATAQAMGRLCHDINNCLTVIMGNAEYLAEVLEDQPDNAEAARLVFEAGERTAALTARVLQFARRTPGKADRVDVAAALDSLAGQLGEMWPGTRIDVSVQAGLPPVLARAAGFEDALRELARNGLDAMAGDGTLCMTASLAPEEARVQITITDSGPGFDAAIIAHCVEPFVTTATRWGAGLGLSTVHSFAAASGGSLHLGSSPGMGASAILELPVAFDPPGEVERADRGSHSPLGHILLVEDDAGAKVAIEGQLATLGCVVTAVSSAAEALQALGEGLSPALMLVDLILPGGMDGGSLIVEVRKTRPDLPAVLMSGFAASHQGAAPGEEGIRILPKPFTKAQLWRVLTEEARRAGDWV